MDAHGPVQARDQKMIGVRAADSARMRHAVHIHLGDRGTLVEHEAGVSRAIHMTLLAEGSGSVTPSHYFENRKLCHHTARLSSPSAAKCSGTLTARAPTAAPAST